MNWRMKAVSWPYIAVGFSGPKWMVPFELAELRLCVGQIMLLGWHLD